MIPSGTTRLPHTRNGAGDRRFSRETALPDIYSGNGTFSPGISSIEV